MSGQAISAALALIAVAVSILALYTARGARVSVADTPTPAPFSVRVMDGEVKRVVADDTRDYALLLSLSSGSDVAVASCLLRVTYRTRANFLGAVDLEARTDVPHARDVRPPVELPLLVKSGQRVERWVFFRSANVIPRHSRVQDYALIISTDTGARHVVDASLPSLLAADTDGQGPATWGWD